MMIKSIEELTIYESPDGGKTVYSRKNGSSHRTLHSVDELTQREERLASRWVKLKDAVFLEDPAIDDLISKIEMLMELKK
jgi:hypothetical protein